MSIALRVAGSWVELRADGNVVIPGSPGAGDRMFLFVAWKTYTITLTTPNGWTGIGTAFADGTTGAGNGTGSVKVMAFYRDWQSGDTSAFLDFSANPAEAAAVISVWSKASTQVWSTPLTATAALSWSSGSTTTSASSTVAVPSGGVVLAMVAFRDDSATMTRPTTAIDDASAAITWNGNHVESPAAHGDFTAGSDGSYDLGYRLVTTGATATLRVTGTLSASETGSAKWVAQGVATATNAYAPTVGASVAIPPRPVGVEALVGRLGYARLSYLVLGTEVARSHLEDSAWVQVATYPSRITSASATLEPTVTRMSAPSVSAPHVTAAAAIPEVSGLAGMTGRLGRGRLGYMTLGDEQRSKVSVIANVAGAPAAAGMAASVAAGTVAQLGASVGAPLVTAAAGVSGALTGAAGAPAAVGATGAISAGIIAAASLPGAATAAGTTATAAASIGDFPGVVAASGGTLSPVSAIAGAPGALAASATVLDGAATTSVYASVNASLVTVAAGPLAPTWHVTLFPATATAAGATAGPSLSTQALASVTAPLVTAAGTSATATAGLAGLVSLATASGATSAPLPAVAGSAPVVAAIAGSQQGGISGSAPSAVGGGPAGTASALVPQISGAYPTPSGEATSVRPT